MASISQETLDEMVEAIVTEVDPDQVVLFGSHARGDTSSTSDIDFLIVKDDTADLSPTRRALMARLWKRLARYPVSQDFLIHTSDEVAEWRDDINHVIARALREGKTVYSRG
jgi:predicted nucleotidyltransferase